MKPLIYGYMRVASEVPDDEFDRIEQQMRRFADAEGFCYAITFFEYQTGSHASFDELVRELQRAEAHDVVVPSMTHISTHPILCSHMVERLELDANAQVHELGDHIKERGDSTAGLVVEGSVVDDCDDLSAEGRGDHTGTADDE